MPQSPSETYAYIDEANVYHGTASSGWRLDFRRFRGWLRQKYGVTKAYIFVGYISKYAERYAEMESAGFTPVFKEVVYDSDGRAKGNCDADLVLRAVVDHYESHSPGIILVSSDGDYAPLVRFFQSKQTRIVVVSPRQREKCSFLLRQTGVDVIYMPDLRYKIGRTAH